MPEPTDGLRDVTRRFLRAYGSAGPEELTRWWLGEHRPRRGAAMLAELDDETVEVDIDGLRLRALAEDLDAMQSAEVTHVPRLLPAFDPWVLGMTREAPLLDAAHYVRVFRPQGWNSPVILVDGRVAGVWRQRRTNRRVHVCLERIDVTLHD